MVTDSYGSLSGNVRDQDLLNNSPQLSVVSNKIVFHFGIMLIWDVILCDLITLPFLFFKLDHFVSPIM